jgi:outer membrane lipoprotein carrier protein
MKSRLQKAFIVLLVLVCGSAPSPAHSDEEPFEAIVASIQATYGAMKSFAADFTQENYIAPLSQIRQFEGRVFLKRPHFFSMEVSSPDQQRLVFDGSFFWVYTAANEQALKSSVASSFLDHPLINLLATMADLSSIFSIAPAGDTSSSSHYALTLNLKQPDTQITEVGLTIQKQTLQIKELVLYYASGNYTRLSLRNAKQNPDIPLEQFQFVPPPGVEVEENLTPLTRP